VDRTALAAPRGGVQRIGRSLQAEPVGCTSGPADYRPERMISIAGSTDC